MKLKMQGTGSVDVAEATFGESLGICHQRRRGGKGNADLCGDDH